MSLDNILWRKESSAKKRLGVIAFAARWMAELHNQRIIHGDAQAKNIAYNPQGDNRYPDLEKTYDASNHTLDPLTNRLLDI